MTSAVLTETVALSGLTLPTPPPKDDPSPPEPAGWTLEERVSCPEPREPGRGIPTFLRKALGCGAQAQTGSVGTKLRMKESGLYNPHVEGGGERLRLEGPSGSRRCRKTRRDEGGGSCTVSFSTRQGGAMASVPHPPAAPRLSASSPPPPPSNPLCFSPRASCSRSPLNSRPLSGIRIFAVASAWDAFPQT